MTSQSSQLTWSSVWLTLGRNHFNPFTVWTICGFTAVRQNPQKHNSPFNHHQVWCILFARCLNTLQEGNDRRLFILERLHLQLRETWTVRGYLIERFWGYCVHYWAVMEALLKGAGFIFLENLCNFICLSSDTRLWSSTTILRTAIIKAIIKARKCLVLLHGGSS